MSFVARICSMLAALCLFGGMVGACGGPEKSVTTTAADGSSKNVTERWRILPEVNILVFNVKYTGGSPYPSCGAYYNCPPEPSYGPHGICPPNNSAG